jgi:hypothetical protein
MTAANRQVLAFGTEQATAAMWPQRRLTDWYDDQMQQIRRLERALA